VGNFVNPASSSNLVQSRKVTPGVPFCVQLRLLIDGECTRYSKAEGKKAVKL